MVKRSPAPTLDEIRAAFDAATAGKGRKLAALIKSFSTDDLAKAFGHVCQGQGTVSLGLVLSFASGLKAERAHIADLCREHRKARRAKP